MNTLSVKEKLSRLHKTYLKNNKETPSVSSSRNSKSRSPINRHSKVRPPSSRTGNYTLHSNSRSDMHSISSSSPRKFLHLQSDASIFESSLVGHKYKNSLATSHHKPQKSLHKNEFSPSKISYYFFQFKPF